MIAVAISLFDVGIMRLLHHQEPTLSQEKAGKCVCITFEGLRCKLNRTGCVWCNSCAEGRHWQRFKEHSLLKHTLCQKIWSEASEGNDILSNFNNQSQKAEMMCQRYLHWGYVSPSAWSSWCSQPSVEPQLYDASTSTASLSQRGLNQDATMAAESHSHPFNTPL